MMWTIWLRVELEELKTNYGKNGLVVVDHELEVRVIWEFDEIVWN
jgi:hypothetical protein